MFAGASSAKIKYLRENPNASVLVTNHVGEPEGWVAFDGRIEIAEFTTEDWQQLIDRVAPKYWDLNQQAPRRRNQKLARVATNVYQLDDDSG